jgi:NAD(P)-dependent dehydrogenase (short-subunit alcohol dehydrogenase family)
VHDAAAMVGEHDEYEQQTFSGMSATIATAVEEIDPALFDEIFHLNVLGPIVALQAVIPLMRAQGGGSIVNIN